MSKPQSGAVSPQGSHDGHPILDRYEPVIGLEVHCQLSTNSKLFCGCSTEFGALPNYHTCPVCLGHPGVLPVLNRTAVDYALRLAVALGAEVQATSIFARKQYFYPDLPKGYQITQYDRPYCQGGRLRLAGGREIPLARIHMEEDAGKNIHARSASYVDLNRAGIPLLEIVSEPALRTPEEAADYLRRLHGLVRHLEISDGNMEQGSMRCDANISLRRRGSETYGTRCEIKNVNSFRNIERALGYEILRQADLLDHGQAVAQETLQFDAAAGKTVSMRSKEESPDYRYFPDPDLGVLAIDEARVERVRGELPELPDAMATRFAADYQVPADTAALLTSDRDLARYFEAVVAALEPSAPAKTAANWVASEWLREANERQWDLADPPVTAAHLAELINLMAKGTISGKIAKTVFTEMAETGEPAGGIVKKRGLVQITDESAVEEAVESVLTANEAQVEQYLGGKQKVFGFFVGQVMKASGGKMNPDVVNRVLRRKLDERRG